MMVVFQYKNLHKSNLKSGASCCHCMCIKQGEKLSKFMLSCPAFFNLTLNYYLANTVNDKVDFPTC